MLFVRADRPVDAPTREILRHLDDAMGALSLPYFIAGALARDLLLTHVFGLDGFRATADVDLGVAVRDWQVFETAKASLEGRGFVRDTSLAHRLYMDNYPVDIIPFGGVEAPERTITWPPDLAIVMNVAGYQEAYHAAERVRVEPALEVPVVSLPGFAVLKIFAWSDRGYETRKDAQDLASVLREYADAGNEERLYGAEIDVLEEVDYQRDLAGALLLGRDARRLVTDDTHEQLVALLERDDQRERLLLAMAYGVGRSEDTVHRTKRLFDLFLMGLECSS